jgi:hypothetical protein
MIHTCWAGEIAYKSPTARRAGSLRKAPRGGRPFTKLLEAKRFLSLILCLLVANIGADRLLIQTHRTDAVTPSPEVIARELALLTQVIPMDTNRRFTLLRSFGRRSSTTTHAPLAEPCQVAPPEAAVYLVLINK